MIFEMTSCGGCRTCEMACSFHHKGEFIPAVSSIKIVNKSQGPGFDVCISEKTNAESIACDGCQGLVEPLCLEYCIKQVDLKCLLEEFFVKRIQK